MGRLSFGYEAMAVTSEARRENIVSLDDARAMRRGALPVSLDMDWSQIHAEEEPWAMGKTIWFAIVISTALWAIIAGALWFV